LLFLLSWRLFYLDVEIKMFIIANTFEKKLLFVFYTLFSNVKDMLTQR